MLIQSWLPRWISANLLSCCSCRRLAFSCLHGEFVLNQCFSGNQCDVHCTAPPVAVNQMENRWGHFLPRTLFSSKWTNCLFVRLLHWPLSRPGGDTDSMKDMWRQWARKVTRTQQPVLAGSLILLLVNSMTWTPSVSSKRIYNVIGCEARGWLAKYKHKGMGVVIKQRHIYIYLLSKW